MNIREAAQAIRDGVDMEQILGLYGYRTKRGVMPCPFHGEKNPSLKIYPATGGWHCFGCGRGGSVIDFVMEHEGCDFRTAVSAIDGALRLGLADPHEDPFEAHERERVQAALDRYAGAVTAECDRWIDFIEVAQRALITAVKAAEARPADIRTAREWDTIAAWKDDDEYFDYRKEQLNQIKEEVAAWRRKARRTG